MLENKVANEPESEWRNKQFSNLKDETKLKKKVKIEEIIPKSQDYPDIKSQDQNFAGRIA